jgi:hypothetical protein
MYDPTDQRQRYLVHYSDGRSGMRRYDAQPDLGQELDDGGSRYRVVRVEDPPNPNSASSACSKRRCDWMS